MFGFSNDIAVQETSVRSRIFRVSLLSFMDAEVDLSPWSQEDPV